MNDLFFWFSKLFWLLVSPGSLLLNLFGSGLLLLWVGKLIWARMVLGTLFFLMILIGLFPVGEWLLYPLESKYQHNQGVEDVEGIIVLLTFTKVMLDSCMLNFRLIKE